LSVQFSYPALADWPGDPHVNVPVSTSAGGQYVPAATGDGAGGVIVAWGDKRNGAKDIFAQLISATGAIQWSAGGVAVCAAAGAQFKPQVVSDGAGGAIIAYWVDDFPEVDIYAQRVSSDGTAKWGKLGAAICAAGGQQQDVALISDGDGGAIAAWMDFRDGHSVVFAQRIGPDGASRWSPNGVALCRSVGSMGAPALVSDGRGGAIVTWGEWRSIAHGDIYAQRVSATGSLLWDVYGVALCDAPGSQDYPEIVSDGAGGAIVAWQDARGDDVYSQRISAEGAAQWPDNGVGVCVAPGKQWNPEIAPDGEGGAIVAWQDARSGEDNCDLYAQRIGSDGVVTWASDGAVLCTAAGKQWCQAIASDGAGGAIATWVDVRKDDSDDIYAQRIAANGAELWAANGVAVCTADGRQNDPLIVVDGGSCIVIWNAERSGEMRGYTQALDAAGNLGSAIVWTLPEP
jgi:hypothetical protein